MYYFFFKVRFSKSRAQGLSPPSNEDNTVAKNEGFIFTPSSILCDLSLSLRVGAFTLDATFCSTNPTTQVKSNLVASVFWKARRH